jgi:hypothetical protein
MANIAYHTGKRTAGIAAYRYRGSYWDCLVVGIFVAKFTIDTIVCCGIVLLLGLFNCRVIELLLGLFHCC